MLKIPRFMEEYANYMKKELSGNPLLNKHVKVNWIAGIDEALALYERGLITVWEAMSKIGTNRYYG